ncbi:MAG: TasA family protein [Patescibacteria group bacterium]
MKQFLTNKRVLVSLGMIAMVAVVAMVGTRAFFSDTETSTGNTFTAGAIDLKVDNESYVTDNNGDLVYSAETSWQSKDLEQGDLFFNFSDLKPGDVGEDTISLVVNNNDAWGCMGINITGTPENGQNEPEAAVDFTTGANEGELQNELNFAFWADDGDNVYEEGEQIFKQGVAGEIFDGSNWALADSQTNIWGATVRYTSSVQNYSATGWAGWSCPADTHAVGGGVIENAFPMGPEGIAEPGATIGGSTYPVFPHYTFGAGETGYVAQNGGTSQTARIYVDCAPNDTRLIGEQTYYVAKAWCFGEMTPNALPEGVDGPLVRGTGWLCNGAPVTNVSQTDGVTADVSFYAVQSRNNDEFTCDSLNVPEIITVESAMMNFSSTGWAGWSCPSAHPNVVGGTTDCSLPLANSLAWEPGATVGIYTYPTTPFGYTYVAGEEGWIVQNGGTGQSCKIYIDCQAN